jgi:hypothetical protein
MKLLSIFSSRRKRLKPLPDGIDRKIGPIVIIGFNKTGTTSLMHFFQENGFSTIKHHNGRLPLSMIKNAAALKKVFEGYEDRYGVFCDLGYYSDSFCFECNQLFRTIDSQYSNVRFIYNYRPVEKWLDSRVNHQSKASIQTNGTFVERQSKFYGTKNIGELREIWRSQRGSFEQDIRKYFSERDNLLEIDIENDDVAREISGFLKFDFEPRTWMQHRKTSVVNSLKNH